MSAYSHQPWGRQKNDTESDKCQGNEKKREPRNEVASWIRVVANDYRIGSIAIENATSQGLGD